MSKTKITMDDHAFLWAEHFEWLERVLDDGLISEQTFNLANKAAFILIVASDFKLPVPAAAIGPDGLMLYCWDKNQHHLELEIEADSRVSFFYRDRVTESFFDEDYIVGSDIPARVLEVIKLFR